MSRIPAPYDRKHPFGSASSNNPSNPIQGADLDAEFNAVEVAIDETQARLAEIQRDDGALKNGIVTADSINPSFYPEFESDITDAVIENLQPLVNQAAASAAESAASAVESQAAADDATDEADRSADEADRAKAEADRARDEADRAEAEANRSRDEADNSATSAIDSAGSAELADSAADRAEAAIDGLLPFYREYNGDGVTKIFTLPASVNDELYVDVYVNGAHISPTQYVAAGSQITFTTAPPVGVNNVAVRIASGLTAAPVYSEDWGDLFGLTDDALDWGPIAA